MRSQRSGKRKDLGVYFPAFAGRRALYTAIRSNTAISSLRQNARRRQCSTPQIRAQSTHQSTANRSGYCRRKANVNTLATAAHKQISQCAALHHPEMTRDPRTDISPRSLKSARTYPRDHGKNVRSNAAQVRLLERKLSTKVMHIVNYLCITFK